MDAWELVLAAVGTAAAVAAAIFAYMQARGATASRQDAEAARDEARAARDESARLAGEANEAFKRQARAQEEANELAKRAYPDWTHQLLSDGRWRVVNTSARPMALVGIEVFPAEATENVSFASREGGSDLAPGDSLTLRLAAGVRVPVDKIILQYRFAEDPTDEFRAWFLTMPA